MSKLSAGTEREWKCDRQNIFRALWWKDFCLPFGLFLKDLSPVLEDVGSWRTPSLWALQSAAVRMALDHGQSLQTWIIALTSEGETFTGIHGEWDGAGWLLSPSSQVLSFAADSLIIKDPKPWQKYPPAGILIFFLPVTRVVFNICTSSSTVRKDGREFFFFFFTYFSEQIVWPRSLLATHSYIW